MDQETAGVKDTTQKRPPTIIEFIRSRAPGQSQGPNHWLEAWANKLFEFTREGSKRRVYLLAGTTFFIWVSLAWLAHPPVPGSTPAVVQFVYSLFAADVLRHMLVLVVGMWLAIRLAAFYLADVFELNDLSVAENFIRSAAFYGHSYMLKIREGAIDPSYLDSPVYQIGGPGRVDVHLENATLFEKMNGEPHVIGPTGEFRNALLEGFERLRSIIDLRDQVIELDVDGRTRDGIPVIAKDVRLVYSVYRGELDSSSKTGLQQPYPFTEQAIKDLVYNQSGEPLINAMRNSVRAELRNFISQHTLSEFLSSAEPSPTNHFVPRDQITDIFMDYAQNFTQGLIKKGVQLNWIGVGTWITPSTIIPERHLEAWKLSTQVRTRRSEPALKRARKDARLAELLRLVDEVPNQFFNQSQEGIAPEQITRNMILTYREKLREARDIIEAQLVPGQPLPDKEKADLEGLIRTIEHLERLDRMYWRYLGNNRP